jgi:hypothetical protein
MSQGSFCWHCNSQLQEGIFAEMSDPLGHVHRVHKACLAAAKRSVSCLTVAIVEVDVRPSEPDRNDYD